MFALFILVPIFLIFVIVEVILYFNHHRVVQKEKEYVSTSATITNIRKKRRPNRKTKYIVTVMYYVNGIQVESELNYYNSSMRVNNKMDIKYNPLNPSEILMSSSILKILLISFGIVSISLLIAIILVLVMR